MKVAIVTPTIGSEHLQQCIDSVRKQTYKDIEHYVKSKGEHIETYRKIHDRLCTVFNEEVMHVIYRTADNMIKEKKHMLYKIKGRSSTDMSQKDYTSIMVLQTNVLPALL